MNCNLQTEIIFCKHLQVSWTFKEQCLVAMRKWTYKVFFEEFTQVESNKVNICFEEY